MGGLAAAAGAAVLVLGGPAIVGLKAAGELGGVGPLAPPGPPPDPEDLRLAMEATNTAIEAKFRARRCGAREVAAEKEEGGDGHRAAAVAPEAGLLATVNEAGLL